MNSTDSPIKTIADVGFDRGFIGYGAHDDGPITPAPAAGHREVIEPPPDRISRFRDWLRHEFLATEIFILDHVGTVIFDESGHGRLHFLARSVVLTSRRPDSLPTNVQVKIGVGMTLEIIPIMSTHGYVVLGTVVQDALSTASRTQVTEALVRATLPDSEN